jgi:hypothetical protein
LKGEEEKIIPPPPFPLPMSGRGKFRNRIIHSLLIPSNFHPYLNFLNEKGRRKNNELVNEWRQHALPLIA